MDQTKTQWVEWLKNIPEEQRAVLANILLADLTAPTKGTNGKSQHKLEEIEKQEKQVRVTRTPTKDLRIENPPMYVDTLSLHEIYKRLAFEANLLIKGPKGDGKSLSVIHFANSIDCPLVVQECSEDTKKYELMGSQFLIGDETVYVLGSLPTAIDVANEVGQCILLFEELNALTPQVQKQLNAIGDFRKMVSLPHIGKTYRLREGAKLWLAATMNPSVYSGTYDLNEDLKSRFEEVEITYPSTEHEKRILKAVGNKAVDDATLNLLIRFAKETRQQATGYALSTRDLVRLVNSVACLGLDIALQLVVCKFEGEDRDVVLKRMSSVFGPKNLKKFWGA
jgi:MoxR-like ATPase